MVHKSMVILCQVLLISVLFIPFSLQSATAVDNGFHDWKWLIQRYEDTDGDGERDDFRDLSVGYSTRLIDFLSDLQVFVDLEVTMMTLGSYPNETALFGNTIDEGLKGSMIFIDLSIISMDEEDGDPGEFYEISKVTIYHSKDGDDDDHNDLLQIEGLPRSAIGKVILIAIGSFFLVLITVDVIFFFLFKKKDKSLTTFSYYMFGVQEQMRNRFTSSIVDRFNAAIAPEYQRRGYSLMIKRGKPFLKQMSKNPVLKNLDFINIFVKKGLFLGTRVVLSWDGEKLDHFCMRTIEGTNYLKVLEIFFSVLFSMVLYGLTFVFFDYWIIIIATMCCLPIPIFLILLPSLIGIGTGLGTALLFHSLTLPPKIRDTNRRDRQEIFKVLRDFAENEAKTYMWVQPDPLLAMIDVSWH